MLVKELINKERNLDKKKMKWKNILKGEKINKINLVNKLRKIILGVKEKKKVIIVGELWYIFGVYMWNGVVVNLNIRVEKKNNKLILKR